MPNSRSPSSKRLIEKTNSTIPKNFTTYMYSLLFRNLFDFATSKISAIVDPTINK